MANSPTFDPNQFHRFGPDKWRNRAVTDAFEPGSIMKAFLIAAVFEEDLAGPHDIIFCENGSYKVADRVFHDTKKHGWLSSAHIIKYSSNIGAAKLGEKLGPERLYDYYRRFGFGKKTGIDLPGEGGGVLSHYKNWSGVSLQTLSFGQGVSTNVPQVMAAMGAIANGGLLMKPYVVKEVLGMDGKRAVLNGKPTIVRRVISEESAEKVRMVLSEVTEKDGTGWRAAMEGFSVAGKTGTAQKPDFKKGGYKKGAYVASFLGFVPADKPKLIIFVAVDEPKVTHTGGKWAAPVFKEIAEQSFSYMGIYPDGKKLPAAPPAVTTPRIFEAGVKESLYEGLKDGSMPDFSGKTIRTVLRMAGEMGADVEVSGSGVAYRQSPGAGKRFSADKAVDVWFR